MIFAPLAIALAVAAGEAPAQAADARAQAAPAAAQASDARAQAAKEVSAADAVDGVARGPVEKAEPVDVVEHLNEKLPGDLHYLDAFQNGFYLRDAFAGNKPIVLTLVYFDCPMLCSLVMQGLIKSLGESGLKLGDDYTALTVSINPKDSPREASIHQDGYLRALRGAEHAHAQDWLFLTGSQEQITRLTQAVGFEYRFDKPTGQYEHPAVTMVITPDGRISRYLYGVQFAPRDLRLAVVEAAAGKVGTTLDRALLKCFKYDPASRRYNLYVWGFVRAGAGLVFFALATLLVVLWRRDLRTQRAFQTQKGKAA